MTGKKSRRVRGNLPPDFEHPLVPKSFAALQRVANIAKSAGANQDDINSARTWPLLWVLEVIRRKEIEDLAEIGRKVSNSRDNEDRSRQDQRNGEILSCACKLLLDGAEPHGLAAKIRKDTKIDLSVRQINRILDQGMPWILS